MSLSRTGSKFTAPSGSGLQSFTKVGMVSWCPVFIAASFFLCKAMLMIRAAAGSSSSEDAEDDGVEEELELLDEGRGTGARPAYGSS